ncbi:ribosome biosynthesis protein [Starmerella bacillaris]|uniref:60S ribosome subunit biogenesis protein NIP7 n=1 Tax=Starmerella bacillaris TaxID=1247836 RepID=A0AAV5RIQ7_STABA|nr:ribosome biosynthesis protein [Starmerella bacillaris]
MRQLTEEETKIVFEKLSGYIGQNISQLVNRSGEQFVLRIQKDRVYYVSDAIARLATSVARPNLLSLGTCLGKFTKTNKFRLHITALQVLAPLAANKVWVKANGEMPFLYGNHVLKAHIGRISDDIPEHTGVLVFSMSDLPLGFGVSAKSTAEVRHAQPNAITVFRQSDIGEFLRDEDSLFA